MNEEKKQLVIEPPRGYAPEIARQIWALEDTRRRTLKVIDSLAPGALDATVQGVENTIGTLLYHIAEAEASWLYEDVLQQSFQPDITELFPHGSRDEAGLLSKLQGFDLDTYFNLLQVVRSRLLDAYADMDIEDFRRPRHFPDYYDVTPEWVLHHLMQHEAEHRGHIQVIAELLKGRTE